MVKRHYAPFGFSHSLFINSIYNITKTTCIAGLAIIGYTLYDFLSISKFFSLQGSPITSIGST